MLEGPREGWKVGSRMQCWRDLGRAGRLAVGCNADPVWYTHSVNKQWTIWLTCFIHIPILGLSHCLTLNIYLAIKLFSSVNITVAGQIWYFVMSKLHNSRPYLPNMDT